MLDRCRVVLVRTHYPGNLGATARVMRNFGLSDLVLVDPVTSPNELDARRMATHGLSLLDAARVVPHLSAAVSDCVYVLATSSLAAGVVRNTVVGTPAEQLPALLDAAAGGPVALVFGPEPHGLSNAEVTVCHGLVQIPVDEAFSSLNLAQAVAISLYELRRLWQARAEPAEPREVAAFADADRMFAHLREALAAVGFLHGTRADSLMHAVRQLVSRARPSPQEVKILHGLARQLLWAAGQMRTGGETTSDPTPPG